MGNESGAFRDAAYSRVSHFKEQINEDFRAEETEGNPQIPSHIALVAQTLRS